jgi:hypothetical protein
MLSKDAEPEILFLKQTKTEYAKLILRSQRSPACRNRYLCTERSQGPRQVNRAATPSAFFYALDFASAEFVTVHIATGLERNTSTALRVAVHQDTGAITFLVATLGK